VPRLVTGLVIALACAIAPAPAAASGSLSFGSPCFYVGDDVTALGSGWTPNAQISLTATNPRLSANVQADRTGGFSSSFAAPDLPGEGPLVRHVTTTATDPKTHDTATASFYLVQPAVDANLNGPSHSVVQWTIAGFTGGKTVYGHWVLHGHERKRLTMGKVPGACGIVRHRAPRIPVRAVVGTWTAQFDTSKTYRKSTPNVSVGIHVLAGP
jgi:hypothetical protein